MSGCLDDNAIVALLEPDVPDRDRAAWMAHIDSCATCRALVVDTVRLETEGPRILVPGTTLGRYVVLETIGAGAMGIVYAAYDPELGRKIALKLLRPDPDVPAAGRSRLLREAQLLAKLAHPNVTSIHDVGTLGDEIFLAMELVEGGATLGAWLATPRDVRAIIRVLRQVGDGLAAAHAAGLVHRDLKPDNVLVDAAERARVTDFGLARGADDIDDIVMVGTPAYMAPELRTGHAADAATDQYSYCVTFYEALYGERPGGSPTRRVPSWLRKIVMRGLATNRAQRFPTMTALLAALAAGPVITARRIAMAITAIALVALVALAIHTPAAQLCTGADHAWAGAWTAEQRLALRDAFIRTGRASAPAATTQLEHVFDERGVAWRAMYTEVCTATRVRGEASEAQLDLRMRCLADRRAEVVALARVLGAADGDLVDRAVTAALALPNLADCANARALVTPLPNDVAARAEIERLGRTLAEVSALEYAGQYAAGRALADPSLTTARATSYAPLVGKFALVAGRLAFGLRDFPRAAAMLHEAAAIAQDTGDDAVAADAWTLLVRMTGFLENRPAEGRIWARYAEG
ncbi:MAG: serine/threonine-protein kinase, partial [Proteobacteria bacterium]|nr:serine/threonine-protein kinase [Pseudomonadota bacterium]